MRIIGSRSLGRLALVVPVAISTSCGGGSSPSSSSSTPPGPAPTPIPAPAPTPTPIAGCGIPLPAYNAKEKCQREISEYFPAVDAAINRVIQEKPYIFNLSDYGGDGSYRILREAEFVYNVIKNLEAQGYCAGLYAEELAVKKTSEYSENFDITSAKGYIRRGPNTYMSTCYPASFTNAPGGPPPPPGCSLPPSTEYWCAREQESYLQIVDDAIMQTTREHPEWFDFKDLQVATDWFLVLNGAAYINRVVEIVRSKGLCAKQDQDEVNIKSTNENSENYDILTASDHVRRGAGSYIVTCWPAQF